jgi:hypothetical protein
MCVGGVNEEEEEVFIGHAPSEVNLNTYITIHNTQCFTLDDHPCKYHPAPCHNLTYAERKD